jgi:hypothetical protein
VIYHRCHFSANFWSGCRAHFKTCENIWISNNNGSNLSTTFDRTRERSTSQSLSFLTPYTQTMQKSWPITQSTTSLTTPISYWASSIRLSKSPKICKSYSKQRQKFAGVYLFRWECEALGAVIREQHHSGAKICRRYFAVAGVCVEKWAFHVGMSLVSDQVFARQWQIAGSSTFQRSGRAASTQKDSCWGGWLCGGEGEFG